MFPRITYLYRLFAVIVVFGFIMVLIHSSVDLSGFPYSQMPEMYTLRRTMELNDMKAPYMAEYMRLHNITFRTTTKATTELGDPFSGEIVNPHDFKYIINPTDLCQNRSLKYVVYIHSAPKNFKKRQLVRQTWGSKWMMLKYNMRIVFLMGMVDDTVTMQRVKFESSRYGDIVLEDFLDTYRNLTYKAIAGLKWVRNHCSNSTYVIKSDDDILIDIHSLMNHMASKQVIDYGTSNLIMCNQWLRMKVIRDKKSKWYVSKEEFPHDYFPPYCSGSIFIMSMDVSRLLYDVSFYTPFFWVDDFYLTGLLVQKLKLKHRRINEKYMLNGVKALKLFNEDKEHVWKFFHVNKLTEFYKMWNLIGKRKTEKKDEECADCFTWYALT